MTPTVRRVARGGTRRISQAVIAGASCSPQAVSGDAATVVSATRQTAPHLPRRRTQGFRVGNIAALQIRRGDDSWPDRTPRDTNP
jgi:hypothetical protein